MGGTTLPTESPATWVGAPRTTRAEPSEHPDTKSDAQGAESLGLGY
jgi:hypothetical protein